MDTYNEWIGPNVITPPTTSESFTLDFKSILAIAINGTNK